MSNSTVQILARVLRVLLIFALLLNVLALLLVPASVMVNAENLFGGAGTFLHDLFHVSTGALYSYFEDKRQIFIEAFQQHLDAISSELLQQLISLPEVLELSTFIEKWIEGYIDLYAKSNHALVQLRLVIVDDKEINHHFSALENTYFSNIADILKTRGIICADLFEKVYISCILIDSLRQEKTSFSHNGLDFEIIKKQVKQSIFQMLST